VVTSPRSLGAQLAERHGSPVEVHLDQSLLNYAELPRTGDWTLRSALVRLAQPRPELAAAVLESMRRCDRALSDSARVLLSRGVTTDRALCRGGGAPTVGSIVDPAPDARVVDLARMARGLGARDFDDALDEYRSILDLDAVEVEALPLLAVVLDLDELADVLADWAVQRPLDVPVAIVAECAESTARALDALEVPRESGPSER
jgi:hypothetical protein